MMFCHFDANELSRKVNFIGRLDQFCNSFPVYRIKTNTNYIFIYKTEAKSKRQPI